MQINKVNLYINKKKVLFLIVLFSIVLLILNILIAIMSNRYMIEIEALCKSDYEYSALAKEPIGQDDYYQINAGIGFSLTPEINSSLNVDVLMQGAESSYTDSVFWQTQHLDKYGVAITKGVANANHLYIGDKIYSKHSVNGEICGYSIEQILPDVKVIRNSKHSTYTEGVVIMGYDTLYIDNISYNVIIFTKESVESIMQNHSIAIEDILYRDDEIILNFKKITPYILILFVLSVAISIVIIFLFVQDISHNFKRLVRIGYNEKLLNTAYNKGAFIVGIIFISVDLLFSLFAYCILDICITYAIILIILSFFKLVVIICTSKILKRKLWRNS